MALNHLISTGYDANSFVFIPYSSKENWCTNYPELKLGLHAEDGTLTYSIHTANDTTTTNDNTGKRKKKRGRKKRKSTNSASRVGLESHPESNLSNVQRDYLHLEIYKYFTLLQQMLRQMEVERKRMGNICATSSDVGELLLGMEKTFGKVIECNVSTVNSEEENGDDSSPMLEYMNEELEERLNNKTLRGQSHSREAGLTFEEYYERLVAFKEEFGHVNGEVLWFGVCLVWHVCIDAAIVVIQSLMLRSFPFSLTQFQIGTRIRIWPIG